MHLGAESTLQRTLSNAYSAQSHDGFSILSPVLYTFRPEFLVKALSLLDLNLGSGFHPPLSMPTTFLTDYSAHVLILCLTCLSVKRYQFYLGLSKELLVTKTWCFSTQPIMGWTVSFHRCRALINLRQHFTTICMDVYGATFGLLYCILFLWNIQITGTVHENANCTKQNEIKWFHFSPSERKHNYFNHQSRWHSPFPIRMYKKQLRSTLFWKRRSSAMLSVVILQHHFKRVNEHSPVCHPESSE